MATLSKAKLRQLDAMSPSDRAFALFTAVEKARSAAIAEMQDEGREIDYYEARQAALAVWNQWAQPLLEEREELEEAGTWAVKNKYSPEFSAIIEIGENSGTQDFLRRADINARSITFIGADWQKEDKGDGEDKSIATGTEPPVKTISCETINLTGFSFPGNADFNGAKFKSSANFSSAQFKGYANFINAKFKGNADFRRAQFKGDASFINATFKGNAYFNGAKFKGSANFRRAQFKGYANFSSATFKGGAYFSSATFKGGAYFSSAQFKGDTYFGSAQFKGDADFISAQFKGDAYFISAQFKGDADFTQADFLTHANFSQTVFSLGSDWTAINAVRGFGMAGARFETQVPQFTQAHFTESPRLDNIEFPIPNRGSKTMPSSTANRDWKEKLRFWRWFSAKPGKLIDKDDIAAFTALRRIAKQGEDHETERKAFKGEMRTQRIAGDHGLPYRLFSWAYDLFTDFGGSFLRPFLLWLALSIASAFIYADAATSPINKAQQATCSHPLTHASLLSARNALLFATAGQRPFVTKSLNCLYGKEPKEETVQNTTRTGPPLWLGLFGTAQTLLSAILIFFILLALRNRFKI